MRRGLLAAALLVMGCAEPPPPAARALTIFLASSLLEASTDLTNGFLQTDSTVGLLLNVAGTPRLVTALERGAPGGVLVTADKRWMDYAVERGLVGAPRAFASAPLVAVTSTRPEVLAVVQSPVNLATPGVDIALAGPDVPLGRYARAWLERLATVEGYGDDFAERVELGSLEPAQAAEEVLARLRAGEADAAIIYRPALLTDTTGAFRELRLPLAPPVATWYVAAVASAPDTALAQAFIAHLLSEAGQATLARHGFLPPADSAGGGPVILGD